MVKQISLDSWQIEQLTDLLKRGSLVVTKTNTPIILYREVLEEEDDAYEEIICTLTNDHVVEQLVTSGGVMPPSFHQQFVFSLENYPQRLMRKSQDLFLNVVGLLEGQLK